MRNKLMVTAALAAAVLACVLIPLLTSRRQSQPAVVPQKSTMPIGSILSSPLPVQAGELDKFVARGLNSVTLAPNLQHVYAVPTGKLLAITTQSRGNFLLLEGNEWRYIDATGQSAVLIAAGKLAEHPIAVFMRLGCTYVSPQEDMVFRLGDGESYEVSKSAPSFTVLPICDAFTDSFSRDSAANGLSDWRTSGGGNWSISSAPDPRFSVSPYHLSASSLEQSTLLCGNTKFREYLIKAAVATTHQPSTIGVIACSDGTTGIAARWTPISGWYGRLDICLLPHGKVLWQRAMRANPDQWYEFQLALSGGNYYFSLDSWPLTTGVSPVNAGMAGLLVRGSAQFDDIAVLPLSGFNVENQYATGWRDVLAAERCKASDAPHSFDNDNSMAEWLPIKTDWRYRGSGRRATLSHKRTFRNDLRVEFSCTSSAALPRFVSLFNAGEGNVRYEFQAGKSLKITILDGNVAVGTAELPANRWPLQLVFGAGLCDGSSAAWVEAEGSRFSFPLTTQTRRGGCDIGISYTPKDLRVYSSSLRDYTFCTAPVDFERNAGNWLISSRWACSPQYSWLGGISDPIAAITSKYDLAGEFQAEIHAAPLMMEYMRPGYRNPVRLFVEAQGDGSPFSGYSFRIYDEGKDVLYDAKTGHKNEKQTYSTNSPHWFHNLWLSLSLGWSNGQLRARNWDGREFALASAQHKPGPFTIWHVKNDFSFARVSISAAEFIARKPNGLDETPSDWPVSTKLEPGIHPLLADPTCVVPREPSSLDAKYAKVGDTLALVLKPSIWGGDFFADIVTNKVKVADYPVMRIACNAISKRGISLYFMLGDRRFFVPLNLPELSPPFDNAVKVPDEYLSREDISRLGTKMSLITVYAGALVRDILRLEDCDISNLLISGDFLALGREASFADMPDAKVELYSLDFLNFSPSPSQLPSGWQKVQGEKSSANGETSGLSTAIFKDLRLASITGPYLKPTLKMECEPSSSLSCMAIDLSGVAKSEIEVLVICAGKEFAVSPNISLISGTKAEFLISANDIFSSSDSESAEIIATLKRGQGAERARASMKIARADFLKDDKTPPALNAAFSVPQMADDSASPWLREWGGPHALYPLPMAKSDRWQYIAQKKLLGGFSGMTLDIGSVDTSMYPYLIGWYCSPDNWALDMLSAVRPFGLFDSSYTRGVPVVTTWPKRDDWHKPKPMFVDLTKLTAKTPILEEIRIGDYYFTSAQEDWGLEIGGLSLVPRIYGPGLCFDITANDVSGIAKIEYGILYRGKTYSVEPPAYPIEMTVADSRSVSLTPERDGLHWLAIRATDNCGNTSPMQWLPFDYAGKGCVAPAMVSHSNAGGTKDWPSSILLKLRGISPPTLTVNVANRTCTLGSGLVQGDSYVRPASMEFDIVMPLLAGDIGDLNVVVSGRGYDGSMFSDSFNLQRNLDAITATPLPASVVAIPANRLMFDDYEADTGSASGRRGALVALVQNQRFEGKNSLLVEAISNYDYFSAYLYDKPYSLKSYPLVSFDYLAGSAKMCLMVKVGGSFYDVQLGNIRVPMDREYAQEGRLRIAGGLGYSSGLIGRANSMYYAGSWCRFTVNLEKLLSAFLSTSDDITVECVAIRAAAGNPIGTKAYVDNFCIFAPSQDYDIRWCCDLNTPVDAQMLILRNKQSDKRWYPMNGVINAAAPPATNGATGARVGAGELVKIQNLRDGEYYLTVETRGRAGASTAEILLLGLSNQTP